MTCPTDQPNPAQPGFRITEITAFTTIGDDDEEGVIAYLGANGMWMPLIAADQHRLDDLRAIVAKQFPDTDVRERRFIPAEGWDRILQEARHVIELGNDEQYAGGQELAEMIVEMLG